MIGQSNKPFTFVNFMVSAQKADLFTTFLVLNGLKSFPAIHSFKFFTSMGFTLVYIALTYSHKRHWLNFEN